jgi:hypothetical protein
MGLETATFISELDPNNPIDATDGVNEGDDHIRLIKSTTLNTWPNVTGAVTLTHTQLNKTAIKDEVNTFTVGQSIETDNSATPFNGYLRFINSGQPANERRWYMSAVADTLSIFATNDSDGSISNAVGMTRASGSTNINSVFLYQGANSVRFATESDGAVKVKASDDVAASPKEIRFGPRTGTSITSRLREQSSNLELKNENNSGTVSLIGTNSGGSDSSIFVGDPDGSASVYNNGAIRLQTNSNGINFNRTGSYQVTYGGSDRVFEFTENAQTNLFFNNVEVFETTTLGFDLKATTGEPSINFRRLTNQINANITAGQGDFEINLPLALTNRFLFTADNDAGAARNLITAEVDNYVRFYAGNDIQLEAVDSDLFTSGARVRDNGGVDHDVGYNVLPPKDVNTNATLTADHCGKLNVKSGATGVTLTLQADTDTSFPIGGVINGINANATANYTVAIGTNTSLVLLLPGTGVADVGADCTVGPGGIYTIYRFTASQYYIWGSNITP